MSHKYNRQGERIEQKDQNQTVHQYTLDKLGRLTADALIPGTDSGDTNRY